MSLDLSSLNPAQREAVTAPDGPTLIVAGPGTGKTHTLAYRIAYLRQRAQPQSPGILAVTFTQKAAGEMVERVKRLCPGNGSGGNLWIGTFHRLGTTLLREEGQRIGLQQDFHILAEAEQASLVKAVLRDVLPEEACRQARIWMQRISVCKHQALAGASSLEEAGEASLKVLSAYEQRLNELNLLDFDDLILKTLCLFQEAPSVRDRIIAQHGAVLVDEYQDINDGQYRLLKELCGQDHNLWIIGDADQAIYAFRGAQVEYFLRFKDDFPGATTVYLEKNYRSTPVILRGAETIISYNTNRLPGKLLATCAGGRPICVYGAPRERAEARFVTEEIQKLVGGIRMEAAEEEDETFGFNEIAVLYRLHHLSRPFVDALQQAGIPFQVIGGPDSQDDSLVDRMLPFLKVISDPHDDHAVKALLSAVDKRFDLPTVTGLAQAARAEGWSLYAYVAKGDGAASLGPGRVKSLRATVSALHRYELESAKISLPQLLQAIYNDLYVGLRQEGEASENALQEALALAEPHAHGSAREQLMPFLETVALRKEGETYNTRVQAVTLMSIHGAKGLEFPVVFLVGLEEGLFPCEEFGGEPADGEEERRLFYVGMTRAKRRLFLSYSRERYLYGEKRRNTPSSFIGEIPARLVEGVRERYHEKVSHKPRVKQRSLF